MRLISIIITIIISFMSSSVSFAAPTTNNVKTYKYENDIKMNGVISSNGKYFNVGDNWKVENAKLNLIFTKSELIDVDYSTITVFVNDTPVQSQKLSGKKVYKKESIIDIPIDLIKDGYNELTIKAYKTISDKVCRDDSNTANWLVVHKESNINLEYSYKKTSNLISEYKSTYLNIDNGLDLNTTILVPDKYTSSELSAGMILSGNFGNKLKYDNFNFDFNLYSDLKNKNKDIIYIGKENNSDTKILNLLTKEEKSNLDKNCVIKQTNSIFNKNRNMLLIVSNNDTLLKNASKLLSSNNLIKNLNENSIIINESTDINDLNIKENENRIYLEELGYENILVKGPFTQETIIDINTPKDKVVTTSSKLKFHLRYANNLDFDRSLVTIYVNETPIGSKKLSKDKSDNDVIELNLPKEVVGKNYYQVKVVFNLELLDLQCVTRDTDNPWAYISNESFIEFTYKDNTALSFANYPYPFVEDSKFNDLKVVVPDKLNSTELTNISSIISYIGRDVDFNSGDLSVVFSKNFNSNDENSNLIVFGTPKNNYLIKSLNKNMNLKFNSDYSGFESNDKIKFIGDYAGQLASIQLINSPFNKDKNVMVIVATTSSDLTLSANYLNNLEMTKSLSGDTIVLDRNGSVEDLSYKLKEEAEDKDTLDVNTFNKESILFIVIAIFLFITVITSILLFIKKYKR